MDAWQPTAHNDFYDDQMVVKPDWRQQTRDGLALALHTLG